MLRLLHHWVIILHISLQKIITKKWSRQEACKCASQIIKNESTPTIADREGILQPVEDSGTRELVKTLVVDVQQVCAALNDRAKAQLEQACAGADKVKAVNPKALAIPWQKPKALAIPTPEPLSSFDARTWTAAFVQFWFGDGAPNLERDRPMFN